MHRTHPNSRTPRRLVAGLALLAVTVTTGLAGCDDDPAAALTEDEWRAEATAICDAGQARLAVVYTELDRDPHEVGFHRLHDEVLPELRRTIDGLDDLDAPASIGNEVERFVRSGRDGLALAEAEAEAEASDPAEPIHDETNDPFAELSQRADRLGLDSCRG